MLPAEWFESWSNGLKTVQTVWKLAEWFTSSPNGMKAVQAYSLWPWQHERLFTEACTNKQSSFASETVQPMPCNAGWMLKAICTSVSWVSLVRLTKTRLEKKLTSLAPSLQLLCSSYVKNVDHAHKVQSRPAHVPALHMLAYWPAFWLFVYLTG